MQRILITQLVIDIMQLCNGDKKSYSCFITDDELVGLNSRRNHHLGALNSNNTLKSCVSGLRVR